MADETPRRAPPEATHQPPPTVEKTEEAPPHEPESASEHASIALEINKDSQLPTEPPLPDEEKLKEAIAVIQKETPLEPPPSETPIAEEHAAVTTSEKDLVAALAVPRESESPKAQSKTEPETEKPIEKTKVPESLASFKEESNKISDLSYYERKALEEFKLLVQEALNNILFTAGSLPENANLPEEVSIWGVPMLKDDRSDVILLKFLRARDFKVKDSFVMLKNTIKWRKDFNVDELLKEDLGDDLEKVVFMQGHDKEGHPVCYNVYGEFQNKELYTKTFADEEKRMRFLRWRIQFLERSIRKLDFSPGGINTIFQVSDLKNSPGPGKKELRIATKQALQILQDNYPEFVAKQV